MIVRIAGSTFVNIPFELSASANNLSSSEDVPAFFKGPFGGEMTALVTTCLASLWLCFAEVVVFARKLCAVSTLSGKRWSSGQRLLLLGFGVDMVSHQKNVRKICDLFPHEKKGVTSTLKNHLSRISFLFDRKKRTVTLAQNRRCENQKNERNALDLLRG